MRENPTIKISVITATWNCAATVESCLDSIAGQTHGNREHVVVDVDRRDGTLRMLQARCYDLSVLISEPDLGIYDALNKSLVLATGDVVKPT